MQWNDLIHDVTAIAEGASSYAEVTGVEYDSRRLAAGSVFVAVRGRTTDGNRYVETAIDSHAAGIITDSFQTFNALRTSNPGLPLLLVEHGRTALAQASSAFFGHPQRKIKSTAVTGTNGKTTTAFLIEALLQHATRSTILVGTIEYHVAGQTRPSAHTTPESRDLFELMADGAALGATELVMEVSSHALDQGRIAQMDFDVAVFTNLTRDHLDYHGSMEEYFAAKALLFNGSRYPAPRVAVLNAGDTYFDQLLSGASTAGATIVTYALEHANTIAEWRAKDLALMPAGAEFTLITPMGSSRVHSKLAGEVNVLNLLAALASAHARGVAIDQLLAAIPHLHPVPGRFQPVHAGQPFTVIVDYAHTDDALHNLTTLARQLTPPGPARVITLFGCGGDRDRTKRPKMGQAAGEGSDFVVATSDNPRSENPSVILREIEPGLIASGVRYVIEPDRAAAIENALSHAQPGDVVLIAGKGHEKQQVLCDGPIHFDDAEVALSALRALGYGGEQ